MKKAVMIVPIPAMVGIGEIRPPDMMNKIDPRITHTRSVIILTY